jgi:hypothetical protein
MNKLLILLLPIKKCLTFCFGHDKKEHFAMPVGGGTPHGKL